MLVNNTSLLSYSWNEILYITSNFHHVDFKTQKIIDLSLAERFRGLPAYLLRQQATLQ
jgi:hypothetical protein